MSDQKIVRPVADTAGPPRSEEETAKIIHEITDLFEHKITFNEFLGFSINAMDEAGVEIVFEMRPELIGHYLHGRLHGGVISSVLDATGGLAVMWRMAEFHASENVEEAMSRFLHLGTVDLRVDFLRQGIGTKFSATSEVVRLGRQIASSSMKLVNEDGVLIATGNATYIVS